jgi:hypothetical protein
MSSAVISTSAAQSRLFIFDDLDARVGTAAPGGPVERSSTAMNATPQLPGVARHDSRGRLPLHEHLQSAITNQRFPSARITPASRLAIRPVSEMVPSGIAALDSLTDGLPRGCITEICGPASSGRTSVLLATLAAATHRGECCAFIDASDALDPHSVAAADIDLDRLLWVRCGDAASKNNSPRRHPSASLRAGSDSSTEESFFEKSPKSLRKKESEYCLEQVLRATDLLLESGGFGLIALDLADLPPESARRIPLTTWFRFRRAIEHTPTILLVIEPQPIAGSCSSLLLQFSSQLSVLSSQNARIDQQGKKPSHTQLLTGLEISAELIRSRLSGVQFSDSNSLLKTYPGRKPAGSVSIAFHSKTSWG